MNSQQLLFFNFLILLALVLFFTLGRSKPKQPTRLNLKDPPKDPKFIPEVPKTVRDVSPPKMQVLDAPKARVLGLKTTYFIFNGHEWDAYEVLGLPRDSKLPTVTSHYQNLIKTSDPSTFEFYDAAYSAILKAK
ncbi:MAG: hypothetical protein ABL930_01300 [Pseudobdellovibrio sp.]